ncbi:hypothetical protein HYQ45_015843 [Verticillium longisporum]|uniref:Roadblock/LAMTOR2 domain-containing protein n=2 Tax=Verticillium TaxID=1036719 RepID=A0A2J8C7I1_VERDA|nr:hypothetical protein HYQ44_007029 [Verticillium longisporum]PNH32963.1 hypothetical protein BJF96_g3754 [Verticillium dahliae]KAG7117454.1 hypothetical protein HYQ45_015843 [Verticillium longisporum]PNH38307.1 hypothetical protein VD0004_g8510 [Verticillium dahliae]PNH48963.1 hypothetical protein VD0003_g8176 [Verticillium dahliae]
MVDTLTTNGHDALDEKLTRLSQKQGVKATVVLDRASGAILRTTGQLSTLNAAAAALAGSGQGSAAAAPGGEGQALDGFAAKVWAWVNASGSLVEELDAEDELKLLRLRTKKQELVIVPDARYLMIVVHDTPPA